MYVVRRSFKAQGMLYSAGTIIEDLATVPLYRSRLGSRDIIEMNEGDKQTASWIEYLQSRVVGPLDPRILKLVAPVKVEAKAEPTKAVAPKVTTTAKPAVAAKPVAPSK